MKILYLEIEDMMVPLIQEKCAVDHEILHVKNIDDAIEKIKKHPRIDIIISDYYLEDESSQRFFSFLEKIEKLIPVLIFSSWPEEEISSKISYRRLVKIISKENHSLLKDFIDAFAAIKNKNKLKYT